MSITLDVGGTLFKTTSVTLSNSIYLTALIKDTKIMEPIFIDRCPVIFQHVLNYLRDPLYIYPSTHLSELGFYGVAYSKYNEKNDDMVEVHVSHKIYKCKAKDLILGSSLLKEKLLNLYIGEILYLKENPIVFKHILGRIYNKYYVIPHEYKYLKDKYGLLDMDIDTMNPDTFIEININGDICNIPLRNIFTSSVLHRELKINECIPPLILSYKKKDILIGLLTGKLHYIEWRFKSLCDEFQLNPLSYYSKVYKKCQNSDCSIQIKLNYIHSEIDNLQMFESSFYCPFHKCLICNGGREVLSYCNKYCTTCQIHYDSLCKFCPQCGKILIL